MAGYDSVKLFDGAVQKGTWKESVFRGLVHWLDICFSKKDSTNVDAIAGSEVHR
jgi:hypothetical protein